MQLSRKRLESLQNSKCCRSINQLIVQVQIESEKAINDLFRV